MKYALVTGASRGIGRAVALDLAAHGFDIVMTYRERREAADGVAADIGALGRQVTVLQLDVAQPAAEKAVQEVVTSRGAPAVLVNNAGITHDTMFAMMGRAAWESVLATNLMGFYNVTRPVVRKMLQARAGRIVNISSLAGQRGNGGQVNYAASKAGLLGATKALALELAPRHITVNAVAPGLIETDMSAGLDAAKITAAIPMGRLGSVEDVAHLVTFLCSPQAAYITGQVIGVNGGLYT